MAKSAEADKGKPAQPAVVSYFRLYNADSLDCIAIVLGILGALANGPVQPLFAYIFGEIIDEFGGPFNRDDINTIAIWFVGLGGLTLVASAFEVTCFAWSGARQVARLRQRFLEACLKQEQAYFDTEFTSGDVLGGLNEDCANVQRAISAKVGNTIHQVTTFAVSIGIALWRGWELALVMFALMPLLAASAALLMKVMVIGSAKLAKGYSTANVTSSETIANMRTVASFQAEERSHELYEALLETPTKVQIKTSTIGGLVGGIVACVMFCTYGIAFLYGSKLVNDRSSDYTAGKVLAVIFASIVGGFSLGQAAPSLAVFNTGRVSGARIYKVINRKPQFDVDGKGEVPDKQLQGNIVIQGLQFAYPARPDVTVFDDFHLRVEAGTSVALVGASGSGKSTAIQLLQRFYDPAAGSITVDGHDIRALSLGWYRDQVGLVSQEPTLFATTIGSNIALGHSGASQKDIQAAAEAANAHSFIAKLPQGYDTHVGERGVQLSGGQKQRVAIARALLKNPRVLLLDEATSALDTVSERLVQDALERLAQGRTTLIVAHRLSTVRSADKIAVLQSGTVVEEGTHTELYSQATSVYHSLVELQAQAMDKRADANCGGSVADADAPLPAPEPSHAGSVLPLVSSRRDSLRRPSKPPGAADVTAAGKKDDELTEEEKATKVGFGRLLALSRPQWPFLVVGAITSALLGGIYPVFALILSSLTVALEPSKPRSEATKYAIVFFGIGVAQLVLGSLQSFVYAVAGARLARRARLLFFKAVLSQEIGWFDRDVNSSGALTARLASDAPSVRGAIADVMGATIQNVVLLVTGYTIAFINGWRMTLLITAVLPLIIVAGALQMKFFAGTDMSASPVFAQANATAHESIMALRTVHSYNLQSKVARIYSDMLSEINSRAASAAFKAGVLFGLSEGIMLWFYAIAFWFGGGEIEKGRMNLEQMLKVFFAILVSSMGIGQAQMSFPDLAKGKSAVQRMFRVIDRTPLIGADKNAGEAPKTEAAGDIEFRNVDFTYPIRPDVPIFVNFSLRIAPGKVTALVGESGSGKSTVVGLIERFYDIDGGNIYIDGVDIRQLSVAYLRSRVGLVSQEPALFNGTVLDNVRIGKADATLEEVQAACEVANAREFIERQPANYETLLGEGGGIALSGGQKQRLAIARAVLKDPRILLLDEATSALDAESERVVQDALDKLMVGRTSVVVAHRLTTIRNADTIAVVQAGVVLEQGSHDELMGRGESSAYVKLARAQAGSK